MGRVRRRLLPLLALACACAPLYTAVGPGRVAIGDAHTVEVERVWSSRVWGRIEAWTLDGFDLQAVRFWRGVPDGEPLGYGGRPFRDGMTRMEIVELFADTRARFQPAFRLSHLAPASFGGAPGFRFEYVSIDPWGVELQGIVTGAVRDARLHLIEFQAVSVHFFERQRDEIERLLDSIEPQQR